MPTYEYACRDCGHAFEQFQNFTDDALTVCAECGGALRKVFGNVGVVFKGSGFYKTDSRKAEGASSNGGSPESASASSSESSSGSSSAKSTSKSDSNGAKTSTSSDSKPAAKSGSSGSSTSSTSTPASS